MTSWQPAIEPWTACDPSAAAARLRARPGLAWLDSALPDARFGRWSIVGSDPRWRLTAYGEDVFLEGAAGLQRCSSGALTTLTRLVEAEDAPSHAAAPDGLPFLGGAVGYLGFELAREVERLPATTLDDVGVPSLAMAWYDAALVWDGEAEAGWLVGRRDAVHALRRRLEDGATPDTEATRARHITAPLHANMTHARYIEAVERARAYIRAGDIYQVNLAQRFSALVAEPGIDVYQRLRRVSPAPFAAYLDIEAPLGRLEVLSSSPERFLLADGGHLETRPIKGTRPRSADAEDDRRLAAELLGSTKDHAEHVMIVDLERNDLGRVAATGTVRVPQLAELESFAQVHHLTSTVTAERRPGVGLEALLRATFPGGSITGAPKVRALEIIDELEPTARGVYTGSLGYISAHGRIDLNIAIRTLTLSDGVAHMHVGGAIVYDSEPEAEYEETLHKARGMARALGVRLPDEGPAEVDRESVGGAARLLHRGAR
ncbi:MAG: aminodeoxychorismate synthase component I [Dehalococcoidia bacterium]|nr:aminodeoxychorismate synthase component I [Dehalococcoidia bacterium]